MNNFTLSFLKKKFDSILYNKEINYATPKIYSNNIIKNKKNATVMLDYNSSNQSFKTKHQLNNTMVVNTSYRSGSRKRDSRKARISWGNNSIVANSEIVPISQQKLMDMVAANAHSKRLESAYYPMRLKKNLVYDAKIMSKLQRFPGVLSLN